RRRAHGQDQAAARGGAPGGRQALVPGAGHPAGDLPQGRDVPRGDHGEDQGRGHRHRRDHGDGQMRRLAVLLAALGALAATAPVAGAALPTREADTLTVGLYMPSPSFQTGAVIGHQVVYAQGFSIDLARALAARMGLARIVFYNNDTFADVIGPGAKPWDVA